MKWTFQIVNRQDGDTEIFYKFLLWPRYCKDRYWRVLEHVRVSRHYRKNYNNDKVYYIDIFHPLTPQEIFDRKFKKFIE